MKRLALALGIAASALIASPTLAQSAAGDRVKMVVVYGDDPAPVAEGDEIVVVARMPENDRFRIPEALRFSDDPANMAWAQRVERLEMIGTFGQLSCSTAGAGGFTGCTEQLIRQAYGERATSGEVRFSQLIAAARAERLSTIDEAARAEQERVEQIEREYMERLAREAAGPAPAAAPPTSERAPGDVPPLAQPPQ